MWYPATDHHDHDHDHDHDDNNNNNDNNDNDNNTDNFIDNFIFTDTNTIVSRFRRGL